MTNYATKHNRADIVLTRNFDEGLTPLAMWGAMETIHQKYEPKFRRKPVTNPTLRMEASPSLDETKGWTLNDWYEYALRFLEEFQKDVQAKEGKKKGKGKFNLDRAQLFACLHFDAKSGIPHLHILINRIDLDGNLMNDSFIGDSAVKAAHAINIERGWELPEDIHKANVNEITDACYKVLSEMRAYSWNDYVDRIKALGYDVKVLEDKDGVKHGYTIMKGNSRYKSSILGVGRDLMLKNLRGTWLKFHKANQVTVGSTDTGMDMAKPVSKPVVPEQSANVQGESSQSSTQSSGTKETRAYVLWDNNGKEQKTYVSDHIYNVIKDAVEPVNDSTEALENCIKTAILLFAGYVDGATRIAESCGGGGSPGSGWGRDKNEKDDDWARRCAKKASWLCKPVVKLKR